MAAAQILPIAGTAASAEVTVAAGSALTIGLKGNGGAIPNCQVTIDLKDDAGNFWPVDVLSKGKPFTLIAAPGTYRISRPAGRAVGVFSG